MLEFITLVIVGFTACVEFGSVVFIHPVIRRLDERHWISFEQGLLRTIGVFMPIAMPAAMGLALFNGFAADGAARPWYLAAAAVLVIGIASTLAINVPINLATGKWDPEHPPADWRAIRTRWELGQAFRGTLQLLGFVLIAAGATLA